MPIQLARRALKRLYQLSHCLWLAIVIGTASLAINLPSFAMQGVVLQEYLRIEVMSKTLYKRTIEEPNWDDLIRPMWVEFRQIMQNFILASTEKDTSKAIPPPGMSGAKIDWENLPPSKQSVDFSKVPSPWFHLQADKIKILMKAVDEELAKKPINHEKMHGLFEGIKDAVLAWQRPPIQLGG